MDLTTILKMTNRFHAINKDKDRGGDDNGKDNKLSGNKIKKLSNKNFTKKLVVTFFFTKVKVANDIENDLIFGFISYLYSIPLKSGNKPYLLLLFKHKLHS